MPLPASGATLTKFAAENVQRRSPSWKPSPIKTTMSYLKSAILPALGHVHVGPVVRADIARFFHKYGRRKPGGANRSHEILRSMFDCAIAWGHRPEAAGNPACIAAVRLLLLTRCKLREIRRLRWCEVKPGRLARIDASTRPRRVLLGEAARELLDRLAETASDMWVFPGESKDEPLNRNVLYRFWVKARDAARIVADARLHDLRDAHVAHAIMNGESLHVAGRLLGHRRPSTTNRYVNLDDATLGQAAERVAMAIHRKLCHNRSDRQSR